MKTYSVLCVLALCALTTAATYGQVKDVEAGKDKADSNKRTRDTADSVDTKGQDIPHLEDETRLVEIKANPGEYVGKVFILCGGIKIDDYYNFSYRDSAITYYSLRFIEAGKTELIPRNVCHLYLLKTKGRSIVDRMAHLEASANTNNKPAAFVLVRVKATIAPGWYLRGDSDLHWDMMEVLDIQSRDEATNAWKPWIIEKQLNEEAKTEQEQAEAKHQAAIKQARADIEQARAEKERKEAIEAAKYRTWTTADGTKVDAKYGWTIGSTVTLTKRDGSKLKVPLAELSAADQEWIANRPK
jgi:hypothetical protein